MKWHLPEVGDMRIRQFFAWLPVAVDREYRWLEVVRAEQRYGTKLGWGNTRFLEPDVRDPGVMESE